MSGYGLIRPGNDENDSWYQGEGGWQPALQNLIRWLFQHHCDEYANHLQDEARSVSDVGEAVALKRLHETLVWLRNQPPSLLTSDQHKELRERRDKAHQLVLYGLRLAKSKLAALAKAEQTVQKVARQLSTPSDRQRDILQMLYQRDAFDEDHRQTTAEITTAVEGLGRGSPENLKRPIADLARKQLVRTKAHRNGGVWLTKEGKKYIKRARKL
jgi:hypothetical protein